MRIFIVLCFFLITTNISAKDFQPVMIGGHDDLEACMTLAAVKVAVKGKSVVIYSSPNEKSGVADRLPNAIHVMICDEANNGWLGIVYSGKDFPDCGVSSSITPRQAYSGQCKSGWLKTSYIEFLAG